MFCALKCLRSLPSMWTQELLQYHPGLLLQTPSLIRQHSAGVTCTQLVEAKVSVWPSAKLLLCCGPKWWPTGGSPQRGIHGTEVHISYLPPPCPSRVNASFPKHFLAFFFEILYFLEGLSFAYTLYQCQFPTVACLGQGWGRIPNLCPQHLGTVSLESLVVNFSYHSKIAWWFFQL